MTSESRENNIPSAKEHFDFDCEHLLKFCDRFGRSPLEDVSESLLEVKLKDLEARWARVDASYEGIMLSKDLELTTEYRTEATSKYEQCTEKYYKHTSEILELIKSFRIESINPPRGQSSTHFSAPLNACPQNRSEEDSINCIKLPPCDTEVFHGSYEQWPSFRDMFTAVYINHTKLTPVTKLYHLRNKTRGEAGDIVKRYCLSHDNFNLAWNALKTRYENKRVLVDNQIKILFDIPSAANEDSESIRRIQSSVNDSLATLISLGVNVESWDPILIRLISTKLPDCTLALWEQSLKSPRELPKWSQMSQFLVDRYEAVERISSIKDTKTCFSLTKMPQATVQSYVSQENLSALLCKLCSENHSLRTCPKFREFTVQQRLDYVYRNKFCNNCLAASHLKATCNSKHKCFHCKKPHHTLLHMRQRSHNELQSQQKSQAVSETGNKESNNTKSSQSNNQNALDEVPQTSRKLQANCSINNDNILLRTALMQIEHRGELFTIRALIDPGSQRTFLSEKVRNRLQLPYERSHFEIAGIGGQKQFANKECEFILYAKRYNLHIPIKAIVLPKVTKRIPAYTFEIPESAELAELDLADPTFNASSQVDLILGNDYEHFLNVDGIKKNLCGQTSAYNTIFGWVLSGPIKTQEVRSYTVSLCPSESSELNSLLKKFWEQEEIPVVHPKSDEDDYCEKLYVKTTKRNETKMCFLKRFFSARLDL